MRMIIAHHANTLVQTAPVQQIALVALKALAQPQHAHVIILISKKIAHAQHALSLVQTALVQQNALVASLVLEITH